jgi:serine/threonine-protein kinase PknG
MNCPNCGSPVKPGDEFCDNCGVLLEGNNAPVAAGTSAQTSASAGGVGVAAPPKTAAKICANCGFSNPPGEDFCDNCGAQLTAMVPLATPSGAGSAGQVVANGSPAAVPSAPTTVKCPRCGNLLSSNDKFCRKCGFNFVTSGLSSTNRPTSQVQIVSPQLHERLNIEVGSTIGADGRYIVRKVIGKGGMGAVFLAEDKQLKRQVVIKAVLQSDDPTDAAQAVKEREFLAAVKHPNIVSIYDFVTVGTDGYIVMEYVNGQTLHQMMEDQNAPFDPVTAIKYTLGILPAFAYLHKLNLIYCDFKPQNVMVEKLRDGTEQLKLIDLGTVIHYEKNPEAVYGTDGFYAPEAVKNPSPETDLYTICRALAYMVSWMDLSTPKFGMPPAEHYKSFRDYPALYRFLYKGTNPVPARRFQTAEGMASQLEGVLRVIAGGQPGVPVSSKLFATTGNLATNTGPLGGKGLAQLDQDDKAIDLLRQGDTAFKQGNRTQALMFYNQAVGLNPNSADAHLRLAEMHIEDGKYSEALAEITRVQRSDPNNWKISWYTGRLLEVQGNLTAARDQYNELVQDLPGELPPLLSLARVQAKLGNTKEAAELYNLVVRADPDNTEALFGASDAYLQQKDYNTAAQSLARVSENSTKYVDAQLRVCDIFLYEKPDVNSGELSAVSTAIRNLQMRNVDTPQFLLAKGDFYHQAWELSRENKLSQQFVIPDQSLDGAGSGDPPSRRTLGKLAEQSYREYLNRNPHDPNREKIVRQKFKVAPWRLF